MNSLRVSIFILCSLLVQTIFITATAVVTNGGREIGTDKITSLERNDDPLEPRVSAWSFNSGSNDEDDWSWKKHNLGVDDHFSQSAKIIQVISYIVIALVLLSFAAFLICLCCPVCILSKIRERRRARRTVAYTGQAAAPLTTHVTTASTLPSQALNGPQMIAINNERSANSPYPVQPSVTLVVLAPSVNASAMGNYNMSQGQPISYQPPPMMHNSNIPTEPPPPYPGHEPKQFGDQSSLPSTTQLPYNPYYSGPSSAGADVLPSSTRTAPPYSPTATEKK